MKMKMALRRAKERGSETVPFDDALRRLVNTPPKHKKGGKSGAGSGVKPKRKQSE
jgi:hypothetical protein